LADQNDQPAHDINCGSRIFLVFGVRGLGWLRHRHRITILFKDLGNGFPARTVGECAMHQNDVFDRGLRCRLRQGRFQIAPRQRRGEDGSNAKILHGMPPIDGGNEPSIAGAPEFAHTVPSAARAK
jgi:hypothetical protein